MNKAIFLDRDGVLLSLVYDTKNDLVRTPLSVKEIVFAPHVVATLSAIQALGYKLFVVSNQPDLALKRINQKTFQAMQDHIESFFKKNQINIEEYYYCFHHPFALFPSYKKICDCKKPKPGLIFRAAKEHDIDLSRSWMIGDGVNDVIAGHTAGCRTILIANLLESGYLTILENNLNGIHPDYIVKKIEETVSIL